MFPSLVFELEAADTPEIAEFPVRRDPPVFRELDTDDDLYPLAEWAWKHGPSLPLPARQEFYMALGLAWPRSTRGDRKDAFMRHLYAWRLRQAGATNEQIAREFCVQADTVRKWIEAGEQIAKIVTSGGREPRVVVAFNPEGATTPTPHAYSTAWMRWTLDSGALLRRRAEDRERAVRVARMVGAIEDDTGFERWVFAF